MKALFAATLLFVSSVALSVTALAQTPTLMSYQGRVSDASGVLLGNSSPINRTVTFKFYTASTGGTPVYAEAQTVTISAGEFSVLLGNGTGVATFNGPSAPAITPYIVLSSIMTGNVYLGITVDDGTAAVDPEITPRQQIVSAAYAFRAKVAEGLLDGSLGTTMLANTAVTTDKIGGAAVTTAKLANDAVDQTKILNGNVTTAKLADGAVNNGKIAANSITSDKISDGTIATADLADNLITSAKILDGTIASIDIADASITTVDLASAAVTTAKVANNAIDYNQLAAAIQQAMCPTGTILAYAGDTAPAGWQLCDGTAFNRVNNPALFAVIGTRFGFTDSTNFRVPDFRGQFLRGRDGGAGRDPDRNSRIAMNSGGAVGDLVGSVQGDQLASHTHGYNDVYYSEAGGTTSIFNNARGSNGSDNDNSAWNFDRTTAAAGGSETRPKNAYVNYIIKM